MSRPGPSSGTNWDQGEDPSNSRPPGTPMPVVNSDGEETVVNSDGEQIVSPISDRYQADSSRTNSKNIKPTEEFNQHLPTTAQHTQGHPAVNTETFPQAHAYAPHPPYPPQQPPYYQYYQTPQQLNNPNYPNYPYYQTPQQLNNPNYPNYPYAPLIMSHPYQTPMPDRNMQIHKVDNDNNDLKSFFIEQIKSINDKIESINDRQDAKFRQAEERQLKFEARQDERQLKFEARQDEKFTQLQESIQQQLSITNRDGEADLSSVISVTTGSPSPPPKVSRPEVEVPAQPITSTPFDFDEDKEPIARKPAPKPGKQHEFLTVNVGVHPTEITDPVWPTKNSNDVILFPHLVTDESQIDYHGSKQRRVQFSESLVIKSIQQDLWQQLQNIQSALRSAYTPYLQWKAELPAFLAGDFIPVRTAIQNSQQMTWTEACSRVLQVKHEHADTTVVHHLERFMSHTPKKGQRVHDWLTVMQTLSENVSELSFTKKLKVILTYLDLFFPSEVDQIRAELYQHANSQKNQPISFKAAIGRISKKLPSRSTFAYNYVNPLIASNENSPDTVNVALGLHYTSQRDGSSKIYCYSCGKPGHISTECKQHSGDRRLPQKYNPADKNRNTEYSTKGHSFRNPNKHYKQSYNHEQIELSPASEDSESEDGLDENAESFSLPMITLPAMPTLFQLSTRSQA